MAQFLAVAIVLIGFSLEAFGFPRIFSNNPAYEGTYFTATYGGVTANDRINMVGIAKMINNANPHTITDEEYNRFANTNEQSTLTIPKLRLLLFCRRTGFGNKSFLNYITSYTALGVGSNDIKLKDFGEEVCRRCGIPNGGIGLNTTITRMASLPTPDNLNPILPESQRFTIWLGLPIVRFSEGAGETLTDESIFAAHKSEIEKRIAEHQNRFWQANNQTPLAPTYGKGYIIYLDYNFATAKFDQTITRDNGLTENDFKIFPVQDKANSK